MSDPTLSGWSGVFASVSACSFNGSSRMSTLLMATHKPQISISIPNESRCEKHKKVFGMSWVPCWRTSGWIFWTIVWQASGLWFSRRTLRKQLNTGSAKRGTFGKCGGCPQPSLLAFLKLFLVFIKAIWAYLISIEFSSYLTLSAKHRFFWYRVTAPVFRNSVILGGLVHFETLFGFSFQMLYC